MNKAIKFIVKGSVQGVGFRYFTNSIAKQIGVYGYVKNRYDGSVEVYAIGTDEQLLNLQEAITAGPSFSRVDNVIREDAIIDGDCRTFNVKF